MSEIILNSKNEATFKMIERDCLNTLQNNTSQSIDEIKKKLRNLLDYYVGKKTLKSYRMNEAIVSNRTTFQIFLEDHATNRWTLTFSAAF